MKYTLHMLGIFMLCLALIGSAAALSLDDLQSRSRIRLIDIGYSGSPSPSGTCELCEIPETPIPTTTATTTLSPSERISGKLEKLMTSSTDIDSVTTIPEEEAVRIALTEIEKYYTYPTPTPTPTPAPTVRVLNTCPPDIPVGELHFGRIRYTDGTYLYNVFDDNGTEWRVGEGCPCDCTYYDLNAGWDVVKTGPCDSLFK
jgi:hypothetical protein